eukprot:gnl/Carplike_NY0171/1370_a1860_506.p1 GENE.gnl/Carplike_NY0171/1370_a1860_506~~gnl/Carplike_NY0171/1370_a1860_506.p1  ORF type:complete len:186 (-),score=52.79 gnl/Carplike_NY0171/1370_a1860_506:38-595(-)
MLDPEGEEEEGESIEDSEELEDELRDEELDGFLAEEDLDEIRRQRKEKKMLKERKRKREEAERKKRIEAEEQEKQRERERTCPIICALCREGIISRSHIAQCTVDSAKSASKLFLSLEPTCSRCGMGAGGILVKQCSRCHGNIIKPSKDSLKHHLEALLLICSRFGLESSGIIVKGMLDVLKYSI